MVDIISPDYQGPERRKTIVVSDATHCPCHLKHESVLKRHTSDIDTLEADMKSRISWKVFALAVMIVVGSIAGLWAQVIVGNKGLDERIDKMDKRLENVDTRELIFENNVSITLQEIKRAVDKIEEGINGKEGDTEP